MKKWTAVMLLIALLSDGTGKHFHAGPVNGRHDTLVPALVLWNRAFARSGRPQRLQPLLAAAQISVMAVFGSLGVVVASIGTPQLASLPARLAPHWGTLVYLGAVATAGMLFLQAVAQRHVVDGDFFAVQGHHKFSRGTQCAPQPAVRAMPTVSVGVSVSRPARISSANISAVRAPAAVMMSRLPA